MTERFLDRCISILVAAVLLLAVMPSLILPTRATHTAPPPNFLPL